MSERYWSDRYRKMMTVKEKPKTDKNQIVSDKGRVLQKPAPPPEKPDFA